jgi:predicted dehydrogenase
LPGPETDRKLIAAEMDDFIVAIRAGRKPEADGEAGLRSVAIIYSILESALSGMPVKVEAILGGKLHAYQDKVEEASSS